MIFCSRCHAGRKRVPPNPSKELRRLVRCRIGGEDFRTRTSRSAKAGEEQSHGTHAVPGAGWPEHPTRVMTGEREGEPEMPRCGNGKGRCAAKRESAVSEDKMMEKLFEPVGCLSGGKIPTAGALCLFLRTFVAWADDERFAASSRPDRRPGLWQAVLRQPAARQHFAALLYAAGRSFPKSRICAADLPDSVFRPLGHSAAPCRRCAPHHVRNRNRCVRRHRSGSGGVFRRDTALRPAGAAARPVGFPEQPGIRPGGRSAGRAVALY